MIGEETDERSPGLVLLTQGNPDPRWHQPFLRLKERLAETLGIHRVYLAHLEPETPNLLDVAKNAAAAGIEELIVLPLFLSLGGEIELEIPKQVVLVKDKLPQLNISLLPPIGEHPGIVEEIYLSALTAVSAHEPR